MNWIIPLAYRAVEEPSVRRDAVSLVFYEYVVQFPFRTRIAAETASIGVHHAASVIAIWRLRLVNGVWKYLGRWSCSLRYSWVLCFVF